MAEAAIDWRHFLGASEWRFDTAVCLLSGQEPRKLGSTQDPSEIDRDWAQWIQAAIGDNKLFPQYNFSHGTLVFLVPNLLRWCHYEAMPAPEPVQEQAVVSAGYWQEQFTLDLKTGGYWLPQECAAFLLGLTPSECEDFRMRYRERVVHQHNWFVRH